MKKCFESKTVMMFILFLAAALISVLVYPEVFVNFKTSFVTWQDYCVEYPLTFVLTNFFYQGGLQLWDFFGQMPLTYVYVTYGLFKLPNVVSAIAYWFFSPLSQDAGQFFYHVFTWANFGTLLFIRVAGIFLLLQAVTKNRVVLAAGTVIFSVFFCQQAFIRGTFLLSYFPLGMYFIVRFFQELSVRYFAAALFFLAITLGSSVLYGACMYLPIHFFIISGIIWRMFFYTGQPRFNWQLGGWKKAIWVIPAGVLIIAPYFYIVKFCLNDIAFGREASRISHPFSLSWYFHKAILELGDPVSFFSSNLNFLPYDDYKYYMGGEFFFLVAAGLILSRNTLKWFFGLGILFLWLLSFPREGFNIGLIAHCINALTNPLKTLPRSYFVANQAMFPCLLMPLAVMGIEVMGEIYSGKRFSNIRTVALFTAVLLGVLNIFPVLPFMVRSYLTVCAILMVAGLGWVQLNNSVAARRFLTGTIGLLVILDLLFTIHQSKEYFAFIPNRMPVKLDASPQSGTVGVDWENPAIFPYRYTYAFHFSFRDEQYIWNPHGVTSDLHHVVNQALNFTYTNGHNPRDAAFEKWPNDPQMLRYLMNNHKFIFLADEAINASEDALGRISEAGLEGQVAMVDDPGHILKLPDQWFGKGTDKTKDDILFNYISGPLIKVGADINSSYYMQGGMILYSLTLPKTFPGYLTTSWFAEEQHYLHFLVEGKDGKWQEFQHTQGELIRPYTFDVQNIKEGSLTAAFPIDDFGGDKKFILYYPSPENDGVTGLWRKQFDNLGITFRAKRDGWLVCHYPYDTKFKISVDGKLVRFYRTNKSFIGFPLSGGEHKILIRYWPDSPLRALLLISACLTTFGLPFLIFLALRWEQRGVDV